MITMIIVVSLALAWLGYETDWLRVNLSYTINDIDIETDYDNSDADFLDDYERQLNEAVEDAAYKAWLDELHTPRYTTKPQPDYLIEPRDRWLVIEEDLTKRRNGEMLYQRIK